VRGSELDRRLFLDGSPVRPGGPRGNAVVGSAIGLGFLLLLAALDAQAQDAGAGDDAVSFPPPPAVAGLELHLTLAQRTVSWGHLPEVRARLENHSAEPVLVLLPCDGSVEAMRVPAYTWEVTLAAGSAAPPLPALRCGNVNAFREEDFVRLEPGEHADLDNGWLPGPGERFSFVRPGRYTIRLRYLVAKADGPYGDAIPLGTSGERTPIEALWDEVPEVEVVSNEVTVTVRAPRGRAGNRLEAFDGVHDGLGMAEVRDLLGEPDAVVPDASPGVEYWVYWLEGEAPEETTTLSAIPLLRDRPRLLLRFDAMGRVLGSAALP